MPKTYERYTCYPEYDHEIYRDAYDGKVDKVVAYMNSGLNIYQKTKISLATPLFLAISGKHVEIIDLLLEIYKRDLQFIEAYFRKHSVTDGSHVKKPILIAYGPNEIKLVENLYDEYMSVRNKTCETLSPSGVVVLLKENNFTPKRVLCLAPQSEPEKMLALKIIQIVLPNGQLYLNGCNYLNDSLIKVTTVNGLFPVFLKLIDLGCDYDAVELSRLAMKSGQTQFLSKMIQTYKIDINSVVENEMDLFNLIGSAECEMFEWIVTKLIEINGFRDNARLFWKNILDMCSDRYYGGTLYNYAIISEQIEFVEKYLEFGPNLTVRNRDGSIPIHHALHSDRYKKLVSDMIDMDNEVLKITGDQNKNILHLMVERNWYDVFVNVSQKHSTSRKLFFSNIEVANAAIQQAIFQNYTEIVKCTIEMFHDTISHADLYNFLHIAVGANANEIVKYILTRANFDICRPTKHGAYPLIMALWNRNIDMYLALTHQNYRTQWNLYDIKDIENNSLLRYTIWSRDYFKDELIYEKFNLLFDELLRAGLKFDNVALISKQNLIHHCALMGNDTILQSLVKLNLDTELWDVEGNLAIHYATNLATFKILNEKTSGRQMNIKNRKMGNTPLHILMSTRFETDLPSNLLEYMLQNGADVNAVNNLNQTPLHLVQNDKWCRTLLQNGANIKALDHEGNTPVHTAFMRSNYEVASMLFDQDIDVQATNNSGFNYLAGFMQQHSSIHPNVSRLNNENLVDLVSAHCNSYNESGSPMLIESMYNNDYLCQMIMNNRNCDVNIRDKVSNRTAIHVTAMYNKFELIERLIEMGADVNDRDSDGNTPLHHTCQFFYEHAIDFLKHGADINATNNSKDTALHYVTLADLHGHTVCQMLLNGANLKAKNNDGNMPYDLLRDDLKQIFIFFL